MVVGASGVRPAGEYAEGADDWMRDMPKGSGGDPETCEEEAEQTCMASELGTLWVGGSAGIDICFFVSEDGAQLTSSPLCNIPGTSSSGSNSYDLAVEAIGRGEVVIVLDD